MDGAGNPATAATGGDGGGGGAFTSTAPGAPVYPAWAFRKFTIMYVVPTFLSSFHAAFADIVGSSLLSAACATALAKKEVGRVALSWLMGTIAHPCRLTDMRMRS